MARRKSSKSRGTHTTFSDLAEKVEGIANRLQEVTGISPGVLQSGVGVAGGIQKVKFSEIVKTNGFLLLTVRQSRSVQELRVYGPDLEVARLALARALRNEGISIGFKH